MWEINYELFILLTITLVIIWIIGRLLIANDECIPIERKRHSWAHIKNLNRSCFCSICEILIPPSSGLFCDCCGVCSHHNCVRRAERKFHCKNVVVDKRDTFKHQWVKGNLPLNTECCICLEDIDYNSRPGLCGYRCCWCQRCVHRKCYTTVPTDENCDFGEFYDMIVPPNSIIAARNRSSLKLHLEKIIPPAIDVEWKPIIVIANTKSGSSTASKILSLFRGVLNPLQVRVLSNHGPKDALQWAVKLSPCVCRILVAGGDGTVDWILNTIKDMKIDPIPEVAILPLGTGNDLSRVMGWGAEPQEFDPAVYLRKIKGSPTVSLDRWLLKIINPRNRFSIKRNKDKSFYFYNYFSVGVDALVTLNFHKARESSFYILSSRIFNKLLYLCFGTHQVVQQDCAGLEKEIRVYLDDNLIDLPDLQSIVCLNIDSWGAGVKLWEMSQSSDDRRVHSIADGQLEVLAVASSFHIAQLQVGLNKPIRLGQSSKIKIFLNQPFPVQIDGEPWIQNPCKITIEKVDVAKMIQYRAID